MTKTKTLNADYAVVKLSATGDVILKVANNPTVPQVMYDHDKISFNSVTKAELRQKEIDRSQIDPNGELAGLMAEHWGVNW
jgi:hypothetical protein